MNNYLYIYIYIYIYNIYYSIFIIKKKRIFFGCGIPVIFITGIFTLIFISFMF